ncbi:MAG TPA: pyridine nucleotide-disulfide oxidoreductase, partial [Actinobacteria bacterium]|nr:pyridine nucleotide-disulfide oxidoreductase [Actinomycetota bacterium]
MTTTHHRIVIVGGGTAGITTAARLLRKGQDDIAIVEPSDTHYYQPLWTLVGGGIEPVAKSARPMAKVMPKGATWIRDAVETIEPDDRRVVLRSGDEVSYDYLVVAP